MKVTELVPYDPKLAANGRASPPLERNDHGHFAKGNKGGPGRPSARRERRYLDVTIANCPPESWGEIVATAVEQAKCGDASARNFLAVYLLGHPNTSLPARFVREVGSVISTAFNEANKLDDPDERIELFGAHLSALLAQFGEE